MAFTVKNELLVRVYVVLAAIIAVAAIIFGRTYHIAIVEGEKWRSKGEALYVQERPIEAERGNILAADGSMLATSMPYYDISFDPNSSAIDSIEWVRNLDSLAYCLATFVNPEYTPGGMKQYLLEQKAAGKRYVPIARNATLEEKELIASFPLFRLGQFKGGLIIEQKYLRERPFGILANRTIGYVSGDTIKVGLEGGFDDVLRGEEGSQLMYRIGDGVWIPLDNLASIQPSPGKDLLTTIDINLQDIVENALSKAMLNTKAAHGTAILMEVETGAIRAIANLGWTRQGQLWETYNFAIGAATEPGSTFKLASVLALLDDAYVDLDDSVDLEQGRTLYFDAELQDAYQHGYNNVTVKQAFEMSSNVGISKLVQHYYGENNRADAFLAKIHDFFLDRPTGIEIPGEPAPLFKKPYSKEDGWSGTTLPWMAIGYELQLTPLQLLTFYNAVANDGVYVKPYIAQELQRYGKTVKRFPVTQVKGRIASKSAIRKAKQMLEGVVESPWGTAHAYATSEFRFAGKTGTAQLGYKRLESRTQLKGYQASFVGYFPAEKPVYSCIVLVNMPRQGGFYGGEVALPVFREIAEKTMVTKMNLYPVVNGGRKLALAASALPNYDAGWTDDLRRVLKGFDMPYHFLASEPWGVLIATAPDSLKLVNRTTRPKLVPNVLGMGLRDALFLLENAGLEVRINGNVGKVREQSIRPGMPARGQVIYLRLG